MGFLWSLNVGVVYALEVEGIACVSRFAARCLKMRPEPKPAKKKQRRGATPRPLPADLDRHDEEGNCPCSDTEADLERMDDRRRELYDAVRLGITDEYGHAPSDVCDDFMNLCGGAEVLDGCLRAAVGTFLPGQAEHFGLGMQRWGGEHGEPGEGAKGEIAYLAYNPAWVHANGDMDPPEGEVNVPWGNKLTPIDLIDREERVQIDAAMMLIAEKLGLKPIGAPGYKLLSFAWGG